jgi:hypothetical protein
MGVLVVRNLPQDKYEAIDWREILEAARMVFMEENGLRRDQRRKTTVTEMEELIELFAREMTRITSQLGEISRKAEHIIQGLARIEAGLEEATIPGSLRGHHGRPRIGRC